MAAITVPPLPKTTKNARPNFSFSVAVFSSPLSAWSIIIIWLSMPVPIVAIMPAIAGRSIVQLIIAAMPRIIRISLAEIIIIGTTTLALLYLKPTTTTMPNSATVPARRAFFRKPSPSVGDMLSN